MQLSTDNIKVQNRWLLPKRSRYAERTTENERRGSEVICHKWKGGKGSNMRNLAESCAVQGCQCGGGVCTGDVGWGLEEIFRQRSGMSRACLHSARVQRTSCPTGIGTEFSACFVRCCLVLSASSYLHHDNGHRSLCRIGTYPLLLPLSSKSPPSFLLRGWGLPE